MHTGALLTPGELGTRKLLYEILFYKVIFLNVCLRACLFGVCVCIYLFIYYVFIFKGNLAMDYLYIYIYI